MPCWRCGPLSIALFAEVATVLALAVSTVVVGGLALSGLGASRRAWAAAAVRGGLDGGVRDVDRGGYYKAAVREAVNPSACFALSLAVAVVISGLRLGGADGGRAIGALVRRRWPRLVVMGGMCSGSFLILMEALARGGLGLRADTAQHVGAVRGGVAGGIGAPAEASGTALVGPGRG